MKRVVLIVMLLVLPYQFAWAAVSLYCNHHEPAGAAHFGHHADHLDHVVADGDQVPASESDLDLDVDHDHYGNTLAVYLAVIASLRPPSSAFILTSSPKPPNSAIAEHERPNWMLAA